MAETPERARTRGPGEAARARLAALALALACVSALACYRPNIANGGFFCAEAGKLCPDGFVCDRPTNTCRTPGSLTDAQAGDVRDAPAGDAVTDGGSDTAEVACFMPVAGCTPQVTSGCDPFCQTGCGCQEKCSSTTAGAIGCHPILAGFRAGEGQGCTVSAEGMATQTDNCGPGLVCVADHCDHHCYRFCRGDADCTNATCTGDAGGGVKICSLPFMTCTPVGGAALTTCPAAAQGCYLSATVSDRMFCDCPVNSGGDGSGCATNLDCFAGLVCVDATGTNSLVCHKVCTLATSTDATACNNCATGHSKPYNGSTTYGFCY